MTARCDRFQSVLLAIILAIGAGVAWGLAMLLAFSLIVERFLPVDDNPRENRRIVVRDGMPLIQAESRSSYNPQEGSRNEIAFYTTDGRRLDDKEVKTSLKRDWSRGCLPAPEDQEKPFWTPTWSQRLQQFDSGDDQWYFVHDGKLDGRAYFVGYNIKLSQKIGYLGRAGFSYDEPSVEEQFHVDGQKLVQRPGYVVRQLPCEVANGDEDIESGGPQAPYLHARDGLIRIDFKNRTAKTFWDSPDLVSAVNGYAVRPAKEGSGYKWSISDRILLRTSDRVIVVDVHGKETASYPIPAELRKVGFTWNTLPDDLGLIVWERPHSMNELFWVDATGKVVRHEKVDLQDPPSRWAALRRIRDTALIVCSVPSPGTIAAYLFCYPWALVEDPESLEYKVALTKALCASREFLFASLISAVLAVLCFLRQRKYAMPWTPVWTIFVLLFGLPAYFGYLAHRAWPGRLPCPHCGQLAPRDRSACFACGREFPEPALKGTEVFA